MAEAANATYMIEVGYTGALESRGLGLWWYPGGSLQVTLNGALCPLVGELRLARTSPSGNSKASVEQRVNEAMRDTVAQHTKDLVDAIVKCLPQA